MTFEELKRIIPNANEREWHQHPNGGGWVQNTASVARSALGGSSKGQNITQMFTF